MSEKRKRNAAKYRAEKGATHELKNIWIPKPDIARLDEVAQREGWIAENGSKAGQMNFQQTIVEVLQVGLKSLGA